MQSMKAEILAAVQKLDPTIAAKLTVAPSFVFDVDHQSDTLKPALEFSNQAMDLGVFRLPFDPVLYEFNLKNGIAHTAILLDHVSIIFVVNVDDAGMWLTLGKDLEPNYLNSFSAVALAFTGLLRTKGVPTKRIKPSRQERRAAERKGQFTHEYTVLDLTGVVAEGGSGRGISANRRLHWRRGHFRRLASGKITSVAPCLVGDKAAGFIEHDYALRC